jgi:hypothetical protein
VKIHDAWIVNWHSSGFEVRYDNSGEIGDSVLNAGEIGLNMVQ